MVFISAQNETLSSNIKRRWVVEFSKSSKSNCRKHCPSASCRFYFGKAALPLEKNSKQIESQIGSVAEVCLGEAQGAG
eukprot:5144158-Amphidinium_carterae.1